MCRIALNVDVPKVRNKLCQNSLLITGALAGMAEQLLSPLPNEDAQIVVSGQSAALEDAPFGVRVTRGGSSVQSQDTNAAVAH